MNKDTLNFSQTRTVEKFKSDHGVTDIQVIKNPHTNKLFFTSPEDSDVSGKVSKSIDWDDDLRISQCTDKESGDTFFMLHNKGADPQQNVQRTL